MYQWEKLIVHIRRHRWLRLVMLRTRVRIVYLANIMKGELKVVKILKTSSKLEGKIRKQFRYALQ